MNYQIQRQPKCGQGQILKGILKHRTCLLCISIFNLVQKGMIGSGLAFYLNHQLQMPDKPVLTIEERRAKRAERREKQRVANVGRAEKNACSTV